MKTFSTFLEAYEMYRLNEVSVVYNVEPDEIILQCPETFQESDIQQYMDDMWLNELPSYTDYAEKFFGKENRDNIYDVYFEYDSYEHDSKEPYSKKDYIEYDSRKGDQSNKDVTLEYFHIHNLKYIIKFDRFDIQGANDETVEDMLKLIFKACESNEENKDYPITIKFDEDSLEFRK